MEYVIWAFTLFLLGFGWFRFNHFYKDNRKCSIAGIIAIMMIGIGLFAALLIYVINYLDQHDLL